MQIHFGITTVNINVEQTTGIDLLLQARVMNQAGTMLTLRNEGQGLDPLRLMLTWDLEGAKLSIKNVVRKLVSLNKDFSHLILHNHLISFFSFSRQNNVPNF